MESIKQARLERRLGQDRPPRPNRRSDGRRPPGRVIKEWLAVGANRKPDRLRLAGKHWTSPRAESTRILKINSRRHTQRGPKVGARAVASLSDSG